MAKQAVCSNSVVEYPDPNRFSSVKSCNSAPQVMCVSRFSSLTGEHQLYETCYSDRWYFVLTAYTPLVLSFE